MKKLFLISLMLSMAVYSTHAQSRKYISQFSQLQNYFNPGLTGHEGSVLKGFVRNQWAGFDGAPQTFFFSGELDLAEIKGVTDSELVGKNAVGINILHETYGAFVETEFAASYAARIRLSSAANLRLGATLNYNTIRLDGNNLNTEQANDPTVSQYLNSFANMQVLDFNLGMALTHKNYYLSYAVQNVNQGSLSFGDVFIDKKPLVNVFQTGFRQNLSPLVNMVSHFMYRTQPDLPYHFEGNVKAILMDRFWVGIGHRLDYANNFHLGVVFSQMKVGYAYEIPMSKSYLIPYPTHEFMASFSLFRKFDKNADNQAVIW